MSQNRDDQICELEDYVCTETTISCSVCDVEDGREEDYAEDFYRSGWRVKFGYCLCPKCVRKFKNIRTQTQADILVRKLTED